MAVLAGWRAAQLDRQLAAGVSPSATAFLALRAQRITRRRNRKLLAIGLARALSNAQDGTYGFTSAVQPDRRAVLGARVVLAALVGRLSGPDDVTARGMAILSALVTDGSSPLYRPSEPGDLGSQLRAAAAALEPPTGCA